MSSYVSPVIASKTQDLRGNLFFCHCERGYATRGNPLAPSLRGNLLPLYCSVDCHS